MNESNAFGKAVRESRRKKRVTIDQVMKELKISKSYLMEIEKGRVAPPREELVRKLEKLFDLKEGELLTKAVKDRGYVKLVVPADSEEYLALASALKTRWLNMSDQQIADIRQILH